MLGLNSYWTQSGPVKEEATFSDALAANRNHLWHSMNYSTSSQEADMFLIPQTTLFSLLKVACYWT